MVILINFTEFPLDELKVQNERRNPSEEESALLFTEGLEKLLSKN